MFGCKQTKTVEIKKEPTKKFDFSIDTSSIPNDTIQFTGKGVKLINGLYYLNDKKFSGIVEKHISKVKITTFSSVLKGKLHGTYRSFFENGAPYEVRAYKNNSATGRHYGYWKGTSKMSFDYTYYKEKREGMQKKWYRTGEPFIFLNFKNDRLFGLQQAWRENGKLYINYEAKENGKNYGLQRSALCYKLIDSEVDI